MKNNKNSLCLIGIMQLLFIPALLFAQVIPKITTYSNFKCEVYIEIYNGLYDWHGGNNYSGGSMPLGDGAKTEPGAVTVANKNDTDGDGMIDGSGDTDVRPGSPALGRNEVDLIKIVVKKVNPSTILTGNVELKITGAVKIWTEPWKGTEIALPYTFPASQLNKTVYLEALESSTIKGIEIEVVYNGKSDVAKATSVWVTRTQYWRENTASPVPDVPGVLENLDEEKLVTAINDRWISMSGNRYGHGEFNRGYWDGDNGLYDKRFGGRILFEFSVSPKEAARVVQFDITRQRKTRTANLYYTEIPFFFPIASTDFPDEPTQNKDNELPNDDSAGADEDNKPKFSFIYSADPPATAKMAISDMPPNEIENTVAFKVSKNSFREFVRVQLKNSSGFPYDDQNEVLGSRASDRYEWHCTYYTKRFNDANTLIGDYDIVSSSIPLKFNEAYIGNGTATVTNLTNDVATDAFFLLYAATENVWHLSNFIAESEESGPPAADGSWTVTLYGVTVRILPGNIPFQEGFAWVFNTFHTAAPSGTKINEININAIVSTTDQ